LLVDLWVINKIVCKMKKNTGEPVDVRPPEKVGIPENCYKYLSVNFAARCNFF